MLDGGFGQIFGLLIGITEILGDTRIRNYNWFTEGNLILIILNFAEKKALIRL